LDKEEVAESPLRKNLHCLSHPTSQDYLASTPHLASAFTRHNLDTNNNIQPNIPLPILDQMTSKHEQAVRRALKSIKDEEFTSASAAALHYGAPPSTVRARVAGRKGRDEITVSHQLLSNEQERVLVRVRVGEKMKNE
jgi:hypothetical protein